MVKRFEKALDSYETCSVRTNGGSFRSKEMVIIDRNLEMG
jgi:hypothetical protein